MEQATNWFLSVLCDQGDDFHYQRNGAQQVMTGILKSSSILHEKIVLPTGFLARKRINLQARWSSYPPPDIRVCDFGLMVVSKNYKTTKGYEGIL
jgi:hypothetical protein